MPRPKNPNGPTTAIPESTKLCIEAWKTAAEEGAVHLGEGGYVVALRCGSGETLAFPLAELNPNRYAQRAVDSVLANKEEILFQKKLEKLMAGMSPEQKAQFIAKLSED